MSGCCDPAAYAKSFTSGEADRKAASYRKNGLSRFSRRLVDRVTRHGVEGASVLEVGGGVGQIQAELLRTGAARAVNVDLSPNWEDAARRLFDDLGYADRIVRRVGDFVDLAATIEPADVVVMNWVVCCYPDMPALVGAAADKAGRQLVMSFPTDRWWNRILARVQNFWLRMRPGSIRVFAHDEDDMMALAEIHGLRLEDRYAGPVGTIVSLLRVV